MNHATALLAAVEIGDPLVRGSLALFPLFHERPPSGRYLSGPRAAGQIQITERAEGAVVPQLDVTNPTAHPVLLLDGETLVGGCQNRIVTTSVVVPAGASAPVSVTCVEAGRWGGEERPVGRSERHAPSAVRARNRHHVVATGTAEADQAGVWEEVDRYATAVGATSATQAMEDVHAHAADRVRALVLGTAPLAGQCGVAAAVGDRIVAVDLFDDPQTLADYWDALVAGYAIDAIDAIDAAGHRPRRRDVRRVLGEVAAGSAEGVGGELRVTARSAVATAVVLDGTVVHLAASPC